MPANSRAYFIYISVYGLWRKGIEMFAIFTKPGKARLFDKAIKAKL